MKYLILCLYLFTQPSFAKSIAIGLRCSVVPGIKLNNKCVYVNVDEDGYQLPETNIFLEKIKSGDYIGRWSAEAEKDGESLGICSLKVKQHTEAEGAIELTFSVDDGNKYRFFKIELENLNQSIPLVKTSILNKDCSKVQIEASLN